MYQPRRHLSQMRTTNFVCLDKKGGLLKKNSEPMGAAAFTIPWIPKYRERSTNDF